MQFPEFLHIVIFLLPFLIPIPQIRVACQGIAPRPNYPSFFYFLGTFHAGRFLLFYDHVHVYLEGHVIGFLLLFNPFISRKLLSSFDTLRIPQRLRRGSVEHLVFFLFFLRGVIAFHLRNKITYMDRLP